MIFSQKFTIHPVGQGLFYSGIFKINTEIKFSMVFDCGTNSDAKIIQTEINLYKKEADIDSTKTLDLLIISHFDKDHVSHIGKLLDGGIKIRKLIMPFITFQERLFLVLRIISRSKGYNSNDEFIINFILDPLGTLKDNLDNDYEIYLIDGDDSDGPIPLTENSNSKIVNWQETRFIFDFKETKEEKEENLKNELLQEIAFSITGEKLFKVNHLKKGKLKTSSMEFEFPFMEFLFYKRNVGQNEKDFFKEIQVQFNQQFGVDSINLQSLVEKIKTIKNANVIKNIFNNAWEVTKQNLTNLCLLNKSEIKNLNTTSLCVLHKNLINISKSDKSFHPKITQIQKFISPQNRVNIPWFNYYHSIDWSNKTFPNVLLTSDTFLLKNVQVDPFIKHYKHYWNDFWLFQIPHHGSEKSSDSLLHSNIPLRAYNFINYGIPNKDKHPSQSVIKDLVATGHSVRLIPVTQYQGLFFELIYP